jgi:hypothetical protein
LVPCHIILLIIKAPILPPSLFAASEWERIAIAWACKSYNALQSECATIQVKQCQLLFEAQNLELMAEEKDARAQFVRQEVDWLIASALEKILKPPQMPTLFIPTTK